MKRFYATLLILALCVTPALAFTFPSSYPNPFLTLDGDVAAASTAYGNTSAAVSDMHDARNLTDSAIYTLYELNIQLQEEFCDASFQSEYDSLVQLFEDTDDGQAAVTYFLNEGDGFSDTGAVAYEQYLLTADPADAYVCADEYNFASLSYSDASNAAGDLQGDYEDITATADAASAAALAALTAHQDALAADENYCPCCETPEEE